MSHFVSKDAHLVRCNAPTQVGYHSEAASPLGDETRGTASGGGEQGNDRAANTTNQ